MGLRSGIQWVGLTSWGPGIIIRLKHSPDLDLKAGDQGRSMGVFKCSLVGGIQWVGLTCWGPGIITLWKHGPDLDLEAGDQGRS